MLFGETVNTYSVLVFGMEVRSVVPLRDAGSKCRPLRLIANYGSSSTANLLLSLLESVQVFSELIGVHRLALAGFLSRLSSRFLGILLSGFHRL